MNPVAISSAHGKGHRWGNAGESRPEEPALEEGRSLFSWDCSTSGAGRGTGLFGGTSVQSAISAGLAHWEEASREAASRELCP